MVVSSFFADIFRDNALNNGLLPLRVSDDFLAAIFDDLRRDPASASRSNLEAQTLTALSDSSERFEIDAYKKKCLLNGYNNVNYLLIADRIEAFEASRRQHPHETKQPATTMDINIALLPAISRAPKPQAARPHGGEIQSSTASATPRRW